MRLTRLLRVAWPAFLSACLLQMVVFAAIDPAEVARARTMVPSLRHDRDYGPPAAPTMSS